MHRNETFPAVWEWMPMGYIRGAEVLLKGFLWLLQWLAELQGFVVQ